MTGKPQLSSDRRETPPPGSRKAIWSLGHAGRPDFDEAAKIIDLGVRMRIPVGKVGLFPSVGYSLGTVFSPTDGTSLSVSGLRGSVTIRLN